MTDITPAAEIARESARTTAGQFGTQQHSAPELTLVDTDPKAAVVDGLISAYFEGQSKDDIDISEVRQLMLDAITTHQEKHPALVVIDGEGHSNGAEGVEVIDLDYLGEWYDDGNSAEFHVERAMDDLDRLRAAGRDKDGSACGWQLREYILSNLDLPWTNGETTIGGCYGEVVIEEFVHTDEVKTRDIETGAVISTYPNYAAAKAVVAPA